MSHLNKVSVEAAKMLQEAGVSEELLRELGWEVEKNEEGTGPQTDSRKKPSWEGLLKAFAKEESGSEKEVALKQALAEMIDSVSDWKTLIKMFQKVSSGNQNSFVIGKIRKKMADILKEIFPRITRWGELLEIWEDTPVNSLPERLVEDRMKKVLNETTAWEELCEIVRETVSRDEAEELSSIVRLRLIERAMEIHPLDEN